MRRQLATIGYHFVWDVFNSRDYLLPQRRNRCWAIATLISQKDPHRKPLLETFTQTMAMLKSNVQFPLEQMLPPRPELSCDPKAGRHADHVAAAQEKFFNSTQIFVDCQGSKRRRVSEMHAVPCLTPSHAVYYLAQRRYLTSPDFLNCQGLFPEVFSDATYAQLMADPKLCQSLAGNSFSSTLNQAVLLASLISCSNAWGSLSLSSASVPVRASTPGMQFQRLRSKRKAPEYDECKRPDFILAAESGQQASKMRKGDGVGSSDQQDQEENQKDAEKVQKKKKGPKKKRKVAGEDSRKKAPGKRAGATIWQKEQLFAPKLFAQRSNLEWGPVLVLPDREMRKSKHTGCDKTCAHHFEIYDPGLRFPTTPPTPPYIVVCLHSLGRNVLAEDASLRQGHQTRTPRAAKLRSWPALTGLVQRVHQLLEA